MMRLIFTVEGDKFEGALKMEWDKGQFDLVDIFYDMPRNWERNGNAFFWKHLRERFEGVKLPLAWEDFLAIVQAEHQKLTNEALTSKSRARILTYEWKPNKLARINGKEWVNVQLPRLKERLGQLNDYGLFFPTIGPHLKEYLLDESCLYCGSNQVIPIIYGLPIPELGLVAKAGIVILGGCLEDLNNPHRHCKSCGREW